MTKQTLIKVARLEMAEWRADKIAPGVVLAILFAFIHRVTDGCTVEETFFCRPHLTEPEYMI